MKKMYVKCPCGRTKSARGAILGWEFTGQLEVRGALVLDGLGQRDDEKRTP